MRKALILSSASTVWKNVWCLADWQKCQNPQSAIEPLSWTTSIMVQYIAHQIQKGYHYKYEKQNQNLQVQCKYWPKSFHALLQLKKNNTYQFLSWSFKKIILVQLFHEQDKIKELCPKLPHTKTVIDAHAACALNFVHFRTWWMYFYRLCIWSHVFIADLSMIRHLNAKLIISTLETEQHAFCKPQFAYISVTSLFKSN